MDGKEEERIEGARKDGRKEGRDGMMVRNDEKIYGKEG